MGRIALGAIGMLLGCVCGAWAISEGYWFLAGIGAFSTLISLTNFMDI